MKATIINDVMYPENNGKEVLILATIPAGSQIAIYYPETDESTRVRTKREVYLVQGVDRMTSREGQVVPCRFTYNRITGSDVMAATELSEVVG